MLQTALFAHDFHKHVFQIGFRQLHVFYFHAGIFQRLQHKSELLVNVELEQHRVVV